MSGLVNLIKNLFSGILNFVNGFLGKEKASKSLNSAPKTAKKSKGYFLEFDDSNSEDVKKSVEDSSPTAAALVEAPANQQPMTVSKETLVEAAKVEVASTKPDAKSEKKSSRKEKLAALAAGDVSAATADKADVDAAKSEPAMVAVAKPEPEAERAFATKYLIPANTGTRRRPGANMSTYLDMARKVNAG